MDKKELKSKIAEIEWNKTSKREKIRILSLGGFSDKYCDFKFDELTVALKELVIDNITINNDGIVKQYDAKTLLAIIEDIQQLLESDFYNIDYDNLQEELKECGTITFNQDEYYNGLEEIRIIIEKISELKLGGL